MWRLSGVVTTRRCGRRPPQPSRTRDPGTMAVERGVVKIANEFLCVVSLSECHLGEI